MIAAIQTARVSAAPDEWPMRSPVAAHAPDHCERQGEILKTDFLGGGPHV